MNSQVLSHLKFKLVYEIPNVGDQVRLESLRPDPGNSCCGNIPNDYLTIVIRAFFRIDTNVFVTIMITDRHQRFW